MKALSKIHMIYGFLMIALLSSCSQDDVLPVTDGGQGHSETVVPVTIKIASGAMTQDGNLSDMDDDLFEGIDEMRIFVFNRKAKSGESDYKFQNGNMTYIDGCLFSDPQCENQLENGIVSVEKKSDTERIAKAYFKVPESHVYDPSNPASLEFFQLYAVAYNKESFLNVTFEFEGKSLYRYNDYEFLDDCATMSVSAEDDGKVKRLDFFCGPVGYAEEQQRDELYIVRNDKMEKLSGDLFRCSGRLTFNLSDIDTEKISAVNLVFDRYNTKAPLGLGKNYITHYAPLTFDGSENAPSVGWLNDVFNQYQDNNANIKKFVRVAHADVENGSVSLTADCLPVSSKVYVEPLDKDGKSMGLYMVHCKQRELEMVYGLVFRLSAVGENGELNIYSAIRSSLTGPFSNLGNLKIDLSWDNDFDSGIVIQ